MGSAPVASDSRAQALELVQLLEARRNRGKPSTETICTTPNSGTTGCSCAPGSVASCTGS